MDAEIISENNHLHLPPPAGIEERPLRSSDSLIASISAGWHRRGNGGEDGVGEMGS